MTKLAISLIFALLVSCAVDASTLQQDFLTRRVDALAELILDSKIIGDDVFRLGREKLDWHAANFFCETAGWHLISLQDTKDEIELKGFLSYYGLLDKTFWTSGNKLEDMTTWRWGIYGPVVENPNWGGNEPVAGKTRNCIYTQEENLLLRTDKCNEYREFICRRTAAVHPTTPPTPTSSPTPSSVPSTTPSVPPTTSSVPPTTSSVPPATATTTTSPPQPSSSATPPSTPPTTPTPTTWPTSPPQPPGSPTPPTTWGTWATSPPQRPPGPTPPSANTFKT